MGFSKTVSASLELFFQSLSNRQSTERRVAVFDADGTFWYGDLGEGLLKFQIERKTLKAAPESSDLFAYYKNEENTGSPAKAYGWLIQWNAGTTLEELEKETKLFIQERFSNRNFEPMRELAHTLKRNEFEVWVLTGSPRIPAEIAFQHYDIPVDRVLGADVVLKNNVLTAELKHEVPFRDGKARLIQNTIQVPPLFAAGNTIWDRDMLITSRDLALAVYSEPSSEQGFESEQKLQEFVKSQQTALKSGSSSAKAWLTQEFKPLCRS